VPFRGLFPSRSPRVRYRLGGYFKRCPYHELGSHYPIRSNEHNSNGRGMRRNLLGRSGCNFSPRRRSSAWGTLAGVPVPELASIDGAITPIAEATIPLADDGLYRGDGVFEVIRLYGGRPFALREHLDRLDRSAAAIELPVERDPLEREIDTLLERFGDADAQLRLVITRGGRRIAVTEELPDKGENVRLATVAYAPTIILTGVKSLSYGANMQATRIAQAKGADEALLVRPDGVVLEAPTSTIFWASPEGGLRTPSLGSGILESITRAQIIRELHVEEGELAVDDLIGAHEAFLASTVREVQPVTAIDGRELAATPGPATVEARDAFDRAIERALAEKSAA
jgi:branched-chain amino acid aminotransferase